MKENTVSSSQLGDVSLFHIWLHIKVNIYNECLSVFHWQDKTLKDISLYFEKPGWTYLYISWHFTDQRRYCTASSHRFTLGSPCELWFVCFLKIYFTLQWQHLSPRLCFPRDLRFCMQRSVHLRFELHWDLWQASADAIGSQWHVGQQRKCLWLSVRLNRF